MSVSTIRNYDESVINYFSGINIDDGVDNNRKVQVLFAVASRRGIKLQLNKNETPIMPLIVVTRTGLAPSNETNIIKTHNIRKSRFEKISTNLKNYNFIETMPYNYNYQIDYFTLESEMFNQLTEILLYKVHKYHYIIVDTNSNSFNLRDNANISNINFSDTTNYNQISADATRMFHGTITFTLNGHILNSDNSAKSILKVDNSIEVKEINKEEYKKDINFMATKKDIENLIDNNFD